MMTCKEIKRKLNLYLDDALSINEKQEVGKHLKKCKNCAEQLAELSEISSLIKEIPVPQARVDFSHLTLCPEVRERLSLYFDGELNFQEKETVEKHLKVCAQCFSEFADLQTLNSLLKEIPVPTASVDLPERIENLLPEVYKRTVYTERRNVWENLLPFRAEPFPSDTESLRTKCRVKPSLPRWAVFTGAVAGLIFLIIRFYTPQKELKVVKPVPPPAIVTPPVVPVPKITTKPQEIDTTISRGKPEVTAEKKEETTVVSIPKEEVTPKEVTAPKVEIVKPKTLSFLTEVKPQVENIFPTTLTREASFTTLSFLPAPQVGLPAPEEQIYTSLYNGSYLWLGLFSSPAKIVKINSSGNYTIYTCATGDDNATSMVYANGSLWVGLDSVPLKILKINPEDGSYKSYLLEESVFADGSGGVRNAVTFDGKYLWFGLWTKPAKLVRINPDDLSYQIYTCKEGEDNPSFALYDGKNVWFGLYTAPAKYLKVNPADGSCLAYTLKEGENYIKTGVYDGKNVWFGLETKPGKLVKVNPDDGNYVAYSLKEGENIITAGTFAQRYLWFSVASEPTKILQVNPYTGNYIAYTRGEIRNISSASFDGKNLWFPDKSGRLLKVSL
jgi:anti-sigma factor RsiW